MKRALGVFLFAVLLVPPGWGGDGKLLTQPFSYREDFESGELHSWAEYPPPQDAAWDPTLVPTSQPAQGKYALQRVFLPVRRGPASFGVIKRIRFLLAETTRIRFSYLLHSYSHPQALRLVLCGTDGKRYSHSIESPTVDRWQEAQLAIADFRAPGAAPQAGLEVQAVYWLADVPDAAPGDQSALYLDNLEITGEQPARLDVVTPRLFGPSLRDTPVAALQYVSGDTIPVAVRVPAGWPKVARATLSLLDPDGQPRAQADLAQSADITWRNAADARLPAGKPGVWKAELKASTSDGRTASADFEFLVARPFPHGVHPRLYFRAEDKPALLAHLRDPFGAGFWKDIETSAHESRRTVNLQAGRDIAKLTSNPSFESSRPYFRVLRDVGTVVQTNAFVYWLTGDPEAKQAARAALLEACQWQTWTLPWFELHGRHTYYPVGIFAAALAFGYDLLYADLSPEERSLVRRAMLEKAVQPTVTEYYTNNQLPFHGSNWISHAAGGALIGLLAVEEDGPLQPSFSALLHELRAHWNATYLPDGSYGEGIDYQRFDLLTAAPLLAAMDNVLGVDLDEGSRLAGSYLYPLYAFLPPDRYLDFGDTADRLAALTPWAWLAAHTQDPHLAWYYKQYLRQRDSVHDDRKPTTSLFGFIWHAQPAPHPPSDLPPSHYFPDKGGVVLRSGWDENALVLNFTAGPFFNHNHFDQGSFWLAGYGEVLLSEAGITEYYTDDFYRPYFIQSVGHNTVLVDGDPVSQVVGDLRSDVAALDRHPRISSIVTSDVHDQLRADLTPAYPQLKAFSRTIMFVKPDYFVLFDRLVSRDKHRYSEIFHPPFADDLQIEGSQAWIRKPKAQLGMIFLAPKDVQLRKRPGHIPLRDIAALPAVPLRQRAYLEASTARDADSAVFLVLLSPQPAAQRSPATVERIEAPGLIGVRIKSGESVDRIAFGTAESATLRFEDVVTDARTFRVSQHGPDIRIIGFENATSFEIAGRSIFRSEKTVSAVRSRVGHCAQWKIVTAEDTVVEVAEEGEILRDGAPPAHPPYTNPSDPRRLTLTLAKGNRTIMACQ